MNRFARLTYNYCGFLAGATAVPFALPRSRTDTLSYES